MHEGKQYFYAQSEVLCEKVTLKATINKLPSFICVLCA